MTVIDGEVGGETVVSELVEMVRLVAQEERLQLDVDRLTGLSDEQLAQFLDAVSSIVEIVNRN